eukprot:TRINITY_DN11946_c0_g2_i2.p1 TRINITY_DN11946_c0_g2~~TRINITY_DN11946_c0_g2_i2.p1  ORF type:complete len:103 (+),score=5.59 TRINITY_DN11946_c0_g2_i2:131-439(+)
MSTNEAAGQQTLGRTEPTYMIQFKCNKCGTTQTKHFSKHAYHHGVVIVECVHCEVKHLIADNLDWFQEAGRNVEDFLQEKGEQVRRMDTTIMIDGPASGSKS